MFSYNLADYFLRGFATQSFEDVNEWWLSLKKMRNGLWRRKLRKSNNIDSLLTDISQEIENINIEELVLMARLSSLAAKRHFRYHIRQKKIAYIFKQLLLNYLIWHFANKYSIVVNSTPHSNPGLSISAFQDGKMLELKFCCACINLVHCQARAIYSLAQTNNADPRSLTIHMPTSCLYEDVKEIVYRLLPELPLCNTGNY